MERSSTHIDLTMRSSPPTAQPEEPIASFLRRPDTLHVRIWERLSKSQSMQVNRRRVDHLALSWNLSPDDRLLMDRIGTACRGVNQFKTVVTCRRDLAHGLCCR